MDIEQNETRRAWGAAGLDKSSLLGGLDNRAYPPKSAATQAETSRNPAAVAAMRRELLREAVHEACAFIRLHAEVCQALAEAGDDAGLLHAISRLVLYAKEVARTGNDLRAIRDAASNKEVGQ